MKKIAGLFILVSIPSLMFASGSLEESDFIQRVINFVIFLAILWYFAFDAIKGIFTKRRLAISDQLQAVQDNLQQAKKESERANKRLEESKKRAKDIVNAAKQEAYLIEQKYNDQIKRDIELLKHSLDASIEFEQRRLTQESVNEVLNELMQSEEVQLNKEDYINIITKRIS
ncbi:F0F1 ATP synthase subunit B [Helicobacter sp. MIT 05-5293]|uniref:ATP synthase subunit b n=1 Tax=uncultured Helicobacter sp. TaxID=175537 RepID=A0A650EJW7_9HELI|nr:F0F1 ATP synthase subunit B [Helicobacter sp. MIT 05-5293]QGT50037.1 ATP synthase subunit b [uncultured Helicobacter sp.]TLD81757.1 F0F1 ATP synthase subunit B [Helicobacter sp. MIT 05-5293]